ncbi:MAG: glycoside hydrolase family 3 N-terminal domain-containing protein, partial [Flavobacteriaceae bacterium]
MLIFFNQTYLFSQNSHKDYYNPSEEILISFEKEAKKLISEMTIDEKASQMVHASRPVERLNIDKYNWWNEALHGVARSAKATVFPQAIAMAATFDTILIKNVANAISDEARAIHNIFRQKGMKNEYTGLTFWSPNINIFRDPRWGRGHETYGEDPHLTSMIGRAFVKGMQGNDKKYLKVAACAKHFAVHSGPENERHSFNAYVSKKDLYETYLPAFKSLVEVNVEAIMCAYNRTNNEPCCGSNELINNILRNSWGFKGHIVSDCGAIFDISNNHSFTVSDLESVAYAVKGGVDLNCGSLYNLIPDAIKAKLLSEEDVDKSLERLLMTRLKLGTIGNAESNPYTNIKPDVINSKKHKNLAKEVAVKSIVLLKNKNNLLPLKKDINTLFITGPNAANTNTLLANYHGLSSEIVTPIEGIVKQISNGTMVRYKMGVGINDEQTNRTEWSASLAGNSDVTIAVMGISALIEGEEGAAISSNANGDRSEIDLPKSQVDYIKTLRDKAGSKPIILVVNSGSALNLTEVEPYVDAILFAWYLGEQGGNAIAEIIFGDANPSGKLPFTIPRSSDQ